MARLRRPGREVALDPLDLRPGGLGRRPGVGEGGRGEVDPGDLPSLRGEPEGVGAVAAAGVEGASGRQVRNLGAEVRVRRALRGPAGRDLRPALLPEVPVVRHCSGTSMRSSSPISRRMRAGTPAATTPAGRSFVTTAPAPTTVSCPMLTPGQTIDAAAEPDVVGDRDRLGRLPADPARLGIDGMRRGEQLHPRRELARGADRDRRDVEHHRVDVDERVVTDADFAVLAVERRADHDVLADVPQQPAQQRARSSHAPGGAPLNSASSSCARPNSAALSASLPMYSSPRSIRSRISPIPDAYTIVQTRRRAAT